MNIFKKIGAFFSRKEQFDRENLPEQDYVEFVEETIDIEQGGTGLIVEVPKESDYIYDPEVSGKEYFDWKNFVVEDEMQSTKSFDSQACTTFSALNCIEILMNAMHLPHEHVEFLARTGYYKNGQINFSDKFTAILSNTTLKGNTFTNVANSIRHTGLIPEVLVPFGDETNWLSWHNPDRITPEYIKVAQEFVRYFDIQYSWVYYKNIINSEKHLVEALKYAPVQIGIPAQASHAVTAISCDSEGVITYIDHYQPVYKTIHISNVHFAMVYNVIPRKQIITTPLLRTLRKGTSGTDVAELQARLNEVDKRNNLSTDGIFGSGTEKVVMAWQKRQGLTPDGIVGKKTYETLFKKQDRQNIVKITRIYEDKQTRGELFAYNTEGRSLLLKTIELPWLDNKATKSCIPPGVYDLEWSYSPAFRKYTYEVKRVLKRSGIRFHPSNYASLLEGCIALGESFVDLNKDGLLDVTNSVASVKTFDDFFKKKPVKLIIT